MAAVRCGIQRVLQSGCDDPFSGDKSFLYGVFASNLRREAWWSYLKKCNSSWWIDFLKDLREEGMFCNSIHVECLRFCFMSCLPDKHLLNIT